MAKAKAKVKAGPKIIDIAHPDDIAPSSNSKSVIIKHQPMMRDPMMAAPAAEPEIQAVPDAASEPASARHEKMIMPDSAKPAAQPDPVEPAEPTEPTESDSKPAESFTISESIPEVDAPGYTSQKPAEVAEADAETEEEERQKVLAELVQKQTYFLPINSTGQHKRKQFLALGVFLAIIVSIVWFGIALDAELIQISGLEAPTNFFSN